MVGPTPANNNNMRPPPPQQPGFMNFPNNNQNPPFPNNNFIKPNNQFFNPFQQQQHSQMFSPNPMMSMMNPALFNHHQNNVNVVGNQQQQQVLLQNTIQNISQLLQLQNQTQFRGNGNNAMPPHQIPPQPFGGVMQHPAAPANPFFQNQIMPQGMAGPQNQNFYMNPMFGMPANSNGPMMQNVNNHGQPRFVSPPSTQIVQTQNSTPTNTNLQDNNVTNGNGGRADYQHKNFTGHKTNDASNKRFKPHKHGKEKFGIHNGNMSKAKANNNLSVNSGPGNSTKFEMKLPSLKYTEHEIKQWRDARKKHYPKSVTAEKGEKEQTLSDVANQADTLRRQQLKEILAKQAELGLEVADIPSSYLSSPSRAHTHAPAPDKQNYREKKFEKERYKKGKFQKRRGKRFQDDRNGKRTRQTHEQKPDEREPSLLQKLLTRDVKRDKNHLLQVFRFIAANSFFNEETDDSLRFPSVIVRETNPQETETVCSVSKGNDDKAEDEEEGELTE